MEKTQSIRCQKQELKWTDIIPISLIKSLASSAGSPQTAGVGCRAAKMSNCIRQKVKPLKFKWSDYVIKLFE